MQRPVIRNIWCLLCLLILAVYVAGCNSTPTQPERTQHTTKPAHLVPIEPIQAQEPVIGSLSPAIDLISQQVLTNIREHGWNPYAEMKGKVTGGLYINWQMNDPSRTNALKEGIGSATDAKHDPQVDLFYLTALAEYQTLHPQDKQYGDEIRKATHLIVHEFAHYSLPKGWIYFYILRDGLLLHNNHLISVAHTIASNYYHTWYDPNLGIVYNHAHSPGVYDPEQTIMCGAALIAAGQRWRQPNWEQAGRLTIDNAVRHALDARTHLFYNRMIVLDSGQQLIQNYQAKPATQGSIVEALVRAYNATHEHRYLDIARRVLQGLFQSPLMDLEHGGMYFAENLQDGSVQKDYKETRSHIHVLIALLQYNSALQSQQKRASFVDREQELISLLTTRFYQAQYHGYFYRMTPNYHVYVSEHGQGIGVEDFFTTEAMGSALDALQQTEFARLPY